MDSDSSELHHSHFTSPPFVEQTIRIGSTSLQTLVRKLGGRPLVTVHSFAKNLACCLHTNVSSIFGILARHRIPRCDPCSCELRNPTQGGPFRFAIEASKRTRSPQSVPVPNTEGPASMARVDCCNSNKSSELSRQQSTHRLHSTKSAALGKSFGESSC